MNDGEGPPGEIFGSALAHAETNVLARLPVEIDIASEFRYREMPLDRDEKVNPERRSGGAETIPQPPPGRSAGGTSSQTRPESPTHCGPPG